MTDFPSNCINHYTHPGHLLTPLDCQQWYGCKGCYTPGTGKRFRCLHGCDFDLHEHCANCPPTLNSFMHKNHALMLMTAASIGGGRRFCDICVDPVDGKFYHCNQCEFDVHPLCAQLPEKLSHALHNIHDLSLEFSPIAGSCRVCGDSCYKWRYRCAICHFDIHIGCLTGPVVPSQESTSMSTERRLPNYYYGHGFPPGPVGAYGPGFNYMYHHGQPYMHPPNFVAQNQYGDNGFNYMYHHGQPYMYPPNFVAQNQYGNNGFNYMYNHGQPYMYPSNFVAQNQYGNNGIGSKIFAIVQQLGMGVLSNMIFQDLFAS